MPYGHAARYYANAVPFPARDARSPGARTANRSCKRAAGVSQRLALWASAGGQRYHRRGQRVGKMGRVLVMDVRDGQAGMEVVKLPAEIDVANAAGVADQL